MRHNIATKNNLKPIKYSIKIKTNARQKHKKATTQGCHAKTSVGDTFYCIVTHFSALPDNKIDCLKWQDKGNR